MEVYIEGNTVFLKTASFLLAVAPFLSVSCVLLVFYKFLIRFPVFQIVFTQLSVQEFDIFSFTEQLNHLPSIECPILEEKSAGRSFVLRKSLFQGRRVFFTLIMLASR